MPQDGWVELRVGDLVASGALLVSDGYRMKNEELGPSGIPFVRGGDIGDGWINTDTVDHIRSEFASRVRTKLSRAGDTAFITKGTVGRAGFLREGQQQVVFSPQVAYWRSLDHQKIAPRYIFYLIRSAAFQAALDADKTHGAMAADYVSLSQQYDFRFHFPPISEQEGIISVLGALDDKIDLNRCMNETLEAMARAIFKDWFVEFGPTRAKMERRAPYLSTDIWAPFPDRLDNEGIPKGWETSNVGAEFKLTMGQSPPGNSYNDVADGLPFFQGCTDFGARYPKRRMFCNAPTRIAAPDDTLVSVRAPVGDLNMAWERCCIGRGVAAVRHQSGHRGYTYYAMSHLQPELAAFEHTGTVFGAINKPQFEVIKIVAPSYQVVNAFEERVFALDERIRCNEIESSTLAARDLLLPKLMSGEIRIKDAAKIVEEAL
jgi:type I restriction enzyme S subunit